MLFGGYRPTKTSNEVLAFYKCIRRRYPDHTCIYLVNDNLSLHWTPRIRAWAESHNVELGSDADLGQPSQPHRVPLPTLAVLR